LWPVNMCPHSWGAGFHFTCINDDTCLIIEKHSNIWFEYPRVIYEMQRCYLRKFVHNSFII
jgi:hypothetical protein